MFKTYTKKSLNVNVLIIKDIKKNFYKRGVLWNIKFCRKDNKIIYFLKEWGSLYLILLVYIAKDTHYPIF